MLQPTGSPYRAEFACLPSDSRGAASRVAVSLPGQAVWTGAACARLASLPRVHSPPPCWLLKEEGPLIFLTALLLTDKLAVAWCVRSALTPRSPCAVAVAATGLLKGLQLIFLSFFPGWDPVFLGSWSGSYPGKSSLPSCCLATGRFCGHGQPSSFFLHSCPDPPWLQAEEIPLQPQWIPLPRMGAKGSGCGGGGWMGPSTESQWDSTRRSGGSCRR